MNSRASFHRKGYVLFLTFVSGWAGLLAQGPPPGHGPSKTIVVEPDTVYFTKTGSETTLTRTVQVRRIGPPSSSALAVNTAITNVSGGAWLAVSPLNGNTLTLTATPGTLGAGQYSAKVSVTPAGQGATPATINVFLTVLSGGGNPPGQPATPAAFVRPASLSFRMTQGGANPDPKALNVSSPTGGASFAWTAGKSVATPPGGTWLQISSTSGSGPGIITVSINGAGLAAGQFNGTVTVTSGASSAQVPVTLQVDPQGSSQGLTSRALVISPRAFNFIVLPGTTPGPKTLRIKTTLSTPINWTAMAMSTGWLSLSKSSGMTPDSIQLMVTPGTLARGSYEGSVKVSSTVNGVTATEMARVFLRIVGPPGGTPPGPTTPTTTSSAGVQITPRAIEFSSTGGAVTPSSATVQLSSKATGFTFKASRSTSNGGNWFSISPGTGSVPGTITVTPNASGLGPGLYTGLITLDIAGPTSEQHVVLVSLRVSSTGQTTLRLSVTPGGVGFVAPRGGPNPASVTVQLGAQGAASIPYQATVTTADGGNWLSVSPASGSAPAGITVSVSMTTLAAGKYTGAVVFQSTGSPGAVPATLNVVLNVSPGAGATPNATLQGLFLEPGPEFASSAGDPVTVTALLLDSNGNGLDTAELTVASSGPEPEFTLENVGGGMYSGVFRSLSGGPLALTASAAVGGVEAVRFGIGGDLDGAQQAVPVIFEDGIVSSASFGSEAPAAPGSILSAFGKNLTSSTLVASTLPLPTELGGVKVLVAGVEAPLISVATGDDGDQINFQLPLEVAGLTHIDVVVLNNGLLSAPQGLNVFSSVPAIFTLNQQGTGAAAALHTDFTVVSAAQPARPGETIVLFATGLGAAQPAPRTGYPPAGLSSVTGNPQVRIGGQDATVSFAGLAPGFVGLYQINVVVPRGVSAGDASLELSVDGIGSGDGVTVAISGS